MAKNPKDIISVPWGINMYLAVYDPGYEVITNLIAHGDFKVIVNEWQTFSNHLVSVGIPFNDASEEVVSDYLFKAFLGNIKSEISQVIANSGLKIFDILSNVEVLSNKMFSDNESIFTEHGLSLLSFRIMGVSIPPDDNLRKIEEASIKRGIKTEDEKKDIELMKEVAKDSRNFTYNKQDFSGTTISNAVISGRDSIVTYTNDFDYQKAFDIFNETLENISAFKLPESQIEELRRLLEEGKELSRAKSDSSAIKNIFSLVKGMVQSAGGSLIATGVLTAISQMGL